MCLACMLGYAGAALVKRVSGLPAADLTDQASVAELWNLLRTS